MQQIQRRILYVLILIAGLAWTGISAVGSGQAVIPTGLTAPQAGFMAPDFTLKTPEGDSYRLSELRGQAVIINLWATWCPPCRAEMPALEQVYKEYKSQGLVILAVNATVQDDPLAVVPFVQKYGLTFPVLLDETGEVESAYEMRSLPTSFFIRRDGRISEVVVGGPMSLALLRTRIEEILK